MSNAAGEGTGLVFKQCLNPSTGQMEWATETDDYDFYQELALSKFADMLHDTERNQKFQSGLASVIGGLKKCGSGSGSEDIHVLDIGCGTGLLSMMAAKLGAHSVTAIEAFMPVACLAEKLLKANGYDQDHIKLIKTRSTDILSEENLNGQRRADVCVAEVFDTELIGEGALRTFTDAHKYLLKPGARVIPARGQIFGQLVESRFLDNFHRLNSIQLREYGVEIHPPDEFSNCLGSAALHDIQLARLPRSLYRPRSEPFEIFQFDFEDPKSLVYDKQKTLEVTVKPGGGRADALLFWWTLDMDGSGEIMLSTQPDPTPDYPSPQWREHWMQAVYHFPQPISIADDDTSVNLVCCHDEYSFWFSGHAGQKTIKSDVCDRPVCTCGLHMLCGHTAIGRLNDRSRYAAWASAVNKQLKDDATCLVVGDVSLLSLEIAQMKSGKIFAFECQRAGEKLVQKFSDRNGLLNRLKVVCKAPLDLTIEDFGGCKIDVVFGDPYFTPSLLPWHNLRIWLILNQLRSQQLLSDHVKILPCVMPDFYWSRFTKY